VRANPLSSWGTVNTTWSNWWGADIGVRPFGKNEILGIVLFDFSLSGTPVDNIRAGTAPYLEPFLSLRKPPRWDVHAERYALAVTLYEMATGKLPRFGDGQSDSALLDGEVTLDTEFFDPDLRETMDEFFAKAPVTEFLFGIMA
jgi:serine/threonine protein kinase